MISKSYGAGLAGITLVPFTGGTSLLLGGVAASTGLFGISRINRGEYSTRNNDKDLVNLHYEIKKTNGLNTKQDSETRELEEQYIAQVEQPIKISDCIIM